jgi:hypothetical protein
MKGGRKNASKFKIAVKDSNRDAWCAPGAIGFRGHKQQPESQRS